MKVRANFYVSKDRLDALKIVASEEDTNVSNLVREAIDAIIKKRLERPPGQQESISAKIDKFLATYAGSGAAIDDIDAAIDLVNPRGPAARTRKKRDSR